MFLPWRVKGDRKYPAARRICPRGSDSLFARRALLCKCSMGMIATPLKSP